MQRKTKAEQIPRSVKEKVWARQGGKSLFSSAPITVDMCCCHFVRRGGKSGLGVEENIFGCTPQEHRLFDGNLLVSPSKRDEIKNLREKWKAKAEEHFKAHYPNWDPEELRFKK